MAISPPDILARAQIVLAPEGDIVATRDWVRHVDAGRIAPAAPPPEPGEHGLASLAPILGGRALPRRGR